MCVGEAHAPGAACSCTRTPGLAHPLGKPRTFMQIMMTDGMARLKYSPQPLSASELQPCQVARSPPRSPQLRAAVKPASSRVEMHCSDTTASAAPSRPRPRRTMYVW